MLRLSTFLRGGGPGGNLRRATQVGSSDGPWKLQKFKLRPLRRRFHDTLISGSVATLTATATQLLTDRDTETNRAFWDIFSKRSRALAHCMTPQDLALIARAFDEWNRNESLYVAIANDVAAKIDECDGLSLVTLVDVFCRRFPDGGAVVQKLLDHIPHVLYQMKTADVLHVLHCVKKLNITDQVLCQRVTPKLMATMEELSAAELASCSSGLARHSNYCLPLYGRIEEAAMQHVGNFDAPSVYRLLWGFNQQKIPCLGLLEALAGNLKYVEDKLSRFDVGICRLSQSCGLRNELSVLLEFAKLCSKNSSASNHLVDMVQRLSTKAVQAKHKVSTETESTEIPATQT